MRIILAGFGIVGRSLADILIESGEELRTVEGLNTRIVAVVDSGGAAVDEKGLNLEEILRVKKKYGSVSYHPELGRREHSVKDLLDEVEADVLVDATPTNLKDGEPSYTYIKKALTQRMHVVTVNKGPLALALPALKELAQYKGVIFRFSGSVGGGLPVIEFARECARGDKIIKVEGVLNGTTNYILSRMEDGLDFDKALREAQEKGYAEKDPSLDIKGMDTAAKLVILANEVLGVRATIKDVSIKGIDGLERREIEESMRSGETYRLIGRVDGGLEVKPVKISLGDPLAVRYSLNAVSFTTVNSGRHVILGRGAGGRETATAIIRDLIEIKKKLTEVS
ncbi:MAG: homoserine dehydrogenase [Aigarchaeota archaeon]|nr:homoserine dehydrogenase [Aigarchaeota archaeon]MCX8192758.1 homoserine dehydrogenase [Nitrososphaeria archaeon]MDW7986005.1 homoserine dehydrogenase [Nitrososphaerota archaeon]